MPFGKLGLIEPLQRAVRNEGYTTPTAIQTQAIPHVLEGKDLLACAQTGTGKTAAFALPIIQKLHAVPGHKVVSRPPIGDHSTGRGDQRFRQAPSRPIRALIMTPTRELAAQIGESFRVYGQHTGMRHTVVFGGVRQGPQTTALHKGVDVLVATPGRLLDLLNQRQLSLQNIEILVLDEADRMLDMGFIHDIRRVIAMLPAKRQTMLFSATMPREIRALADTLMHHPVEVSVPSESPAADTVEQCLYHVESTIKPALLEQLLADASITRALVFSRTKHGADKIVKRLGQAQIRAEAIHSNKSQNARIRALDNFKRGTIRVLVASDIAARGLDVDNISHVINYDLPNEPETYVHRIGRTGRAGATGKAISFCSSDQRNLLRDIERLLGNHILVAKHALSAPAPSPMQQQARATGGGQQQRHGSGSAPAGHSRKTPSPEKQKTDFWRSRRKTGRPFPAKPSSGKHRGGY